jgi:hypothetical protein
LFEDDPAERRGERGEEALLARLVEATTASPMNFSTVPPWCSSAERISWK